MLVDLGVLEEFPSNRIPGFSDALVALLPTLEDHACSLGRRGGFITRLQEGTWAGHIAEHIALEFQNLAGTDVRHGKTRSAGVHGQYNCIYEYREEAVGLEAGRMAVAPRQPPRRARRPRRLLRLRERAREADPAGRAPGVRPVDAGAHRRGRQPRHPVHPARPPLARAVRSRRPPAADPRDDDLEDVRDRRRHRVGQEPDQSTARQCRPARSRAPTSSTTEDEAVTVAKRLGFPCVVKPLDGNHGRGVHLDLRSEEAVRAAFPGALSQSRSGDVVVETYVAGNDYRCLVIGGKVAAIAERVPAAVTGDGEHTVRQLVDIANSRPAPRHRPREGADPDQGRRGGRGAGPRPGLRARRRSRPTAPGSSSP